MSNSNGSPLARYGSWPIVLGTLALSLLVAFVLSAPLAGLTRFTGRALLDDGSLIDPWVVSLAIIAQGVGLLVALYVVVLRSRRVGWEHLGLARLPNRGDVLRGISWGLLFVVISAVIEIVLRASGIEQTQADMFPLESATTIQLVAMWAAGVGVAPVVEEIFFRGYVFQAMAVRKGLLRGLLYSSIVFAATHVNLAAFIPLAAGAAILALSYRRTGTLWVPIVAHALNNAFAFAVLGTQGTLAGASFFLPPQILG